MSTGPQNEEPQQKRAQEVRRFVIGHGEKLKEARGWCWHVPIPTQTFLLEGEARQVQGMGMDKWPVRVMEVLGSVPLGGS